MVTMSHIGGEVYLENPDDKQIEDTIRSLDGVKTTYMTINLKDSETWMGIGGGKDDKYVVFIQNDHYIHLVNSNNTTDEETELFICGQFDSWSLRKIVDLVNAIKAAKTFIETGSRDTSLTWE